MRDLQKEETARQRRERILLFLYKYHWFSTHATEDKPYTKEKELVKAKLESFGVTDIEGMIQAAGDKMETLDPKLFLLDEPRFFICNECQKPMETGHGAIHYHCIECSDYDICPECHAAGKHSHHESYPEAEAPEILLARPKARNTVGGMLIEAFKAFADRPCLGERKLLPDGSFENKYTWTSFNEVGTRVFNFYSGLKGLLGLAQQSRVSVCGKNAINWFVCDWACAIGGIVNVPLHHVFEKKTVVHIINTAKVSTVICMKETTKLFIQLMKESGLCPTLKWIVQMEPLEDDERQDHVTDMKTLEDYGKSHVLSEQDLPKVSPDDLYTIVFTSGSTGTPKGVAFNEKTCVAERAAYNNSADPNVVISLNSLSHVSDRETVCALICGGGRVGMLSRPENTFEDMRILSPSQVSFTPRIYNIFYSEFERLWQSKRAEYLEDCSKKGIDFDPVALNNIREECKTEISKWFGTRVKAVTVGGAALNPKVKEFLIEVYGEKAVYEGYGTTESSHIADNNGYIFSRVEWRIEDVPEMGYHKSDLPFPRGELLVKSMKSVQSYFESEEETAAAFTSDGFFRTGDIVEIIGTGRLRVIDRRKALFKLAQGEFVSPARIEEALCTSPLCNSVYVTFSSLTKYQDNAVVAVVVPDETLLRSRLSKIPTIPSDMPFSNLCETREACASVLAEIRSVAIKQSLRQFEVPVVVALDPIPWTIENGMLTASQKINRPNVQRVYAAKVKTLAELIVDQSPEDEKKKTEIAKTVSDVLGIPESEVGDNIADTFARVGGDSLSAIRLVAELKQQFNVDVNMRELFTSDSSKDTSSSSSSSSTESTSSGQRQFSLTGAYQPSISLASTASSTEADQDSLARLVEQFKSDSCIDFDETKWSYRCETKKDFNGDVFLTGSTGFLGIHILDEFIRANKNDRRIYCLIRAENDIAAREKLLRRARQFLMKPFGDDDFSWAKNKEALWKRVIVVCGDLEKPGLGISEEARRDVVMNAAVFIHAGAYVNHVLPYERLRAANVLGSLAVAELSFQSNACMFCGVSTISVMQDVNVYSFEQLTSTIGYVQTKAVAEQMIYKSSLKHHYSALVVRPAMLSWSSRTGAFNREDWLMRWLIGCISVGCAPSVSNLRLYLIPVDFMARGILELSSSASYLNSSYNVDNVMNPLPASKLFNVLAACAQSQLSLGQSGGDGILHGLLKNTAALSSQVNFCIWQEVVRREQKRLLNSSSHDGDDKYLEMRKEYVAGLSMFLNALPADGVVTWQVYYYTTMRYPVLDTTYVATLFDGFVQSS